MPPAVITLIFPEAPEPTVAVIVVELTTVKEDAATPPMLTPVTPVKFEPVIVTTVPAVPLAGLKEVIESPV